MRPIPTALLALATLLASCATGGDRWYATAYGGKSANDRSDLHLRRGGADLVFEDVHLDDGSELSPPFYGARAGHWFEADRSGLGLALDYTHAKAYADESQVVRYSGTEGGAPVSGTAPISDRIQVFEMSDGHNFLTANLLYRWVLAGPEDDLARRFRPYVGLGAGAAIPHFEAKIDGDETFAFQLAGWTVQGMAGLEVQAWGPLSVMLEYKANFARVDGDLVGGGDLAVDTWTHQAILGLQLRF